MPSYLTPFFGAAGQSYADEESRRRAEALKRFIEAGRRGGVIDRGPSATEMLQRKDLSVLGMDKRQPSSGVEDYVSEGMERRAPEQVETDPLAKDRTQILRDYSGYAGVSGMREVLESIAKGEDFDPNETRFELSLGAFREKRMQAFAEQEAGAIKRSKEEAAKMSEETAKEVTYGMHTYPDMKTFIANELKPLLTKKRSLEREGTAPFETMKPLQSRIDRVMDRAYGADTPTRRFVNSIQGNAKRMQLMIEGGLSDDKLQQLRDMGVDVEVAIDIINMMYNE